MKHRRSMRLFTLAMGTTALLAGSFFAGHAVAKAAVVPTASFLYRVDAGDQMWYLAKVYDTTVAAILTANHLQSTVLHAGQTLAIPTDQQRMLATAYDASAASNGPWGAVDYFGNPLRFGDVAVDPSVIPLGSTVYITGYSDPALPAGGFYATAVDTGGAIVGNRIDLFIPGQRNADDFGMEHVTVTVVRK